MNLCRKFGPLMITACVGAAGCHAPSKSEAPLDTAGPVVATGIGLDAAREAQRQSALRQHLRILESVKPRWLLDSTARIVTAERIAAGDFSPAELYEVGRLIFEHDTTFADGLGGARARAVAEEGRESPFHRVHEGRFGGPDTTSCGSCHWRGGPAGAGGLQDNSFLFGDGDRISTADARNPPSLQGVGPVQALAVEMSAELQAARDEIVRRARSEGRAVEGPISAKGVSFGILRAAADGGLDFTRVEGVDRDLVIKPFGWKGTFATVRGFVQESLQVHFGMQAEEIVEQNRIQPDPELLGRGANPRDPDGDGVERELTEGQVTALVAYLAMQEMPVVKPPETLHHSQPRAPNLIAPTATVFTPRWTRGRELFHAIGCATCHVPMLPLKDPTFRTRGGVSGATTQIDLSRHGESPRIERDPLLDAYPLWLFSDLKRHDMGRESASLHEDHGVPVQQYLTRRLWGLASSPPYFYDGHAPWFDHAIQAHGGEAAASRNAFIALGREEKGAVRLYLLSLRRERRVVVP